jgi:hypothetical protein
VFDVDDDKKVFIDRPNLSGVTPFNCIDFDCDGYKKISIIDTDGSFTGDGTPGTIIPDSAYEWDGDPARGLGFYRIPSQMIFVDGVKMDYADLMPNTGIIRNENCTWRDDWVAYSCHGLNHRIMIIESLDRDTQIRRLSPIAVLADAGPAGYIDLVNGPQDHTCCSGYTCAFRLSTFYTMVATGHDYEVMMSSIPPQNIRLHMLHNEIFNWYCQT